MAENYSYLYNWMTVNFYFLAVNMLSRAIFVNLRKTRRNLQIHFIFIISYALAGFFYGWAFKIVFNYNAVSKEYFSKPDTFIWH